MKLERFAYFLAVAQTGSITLGAQKSFITQTAMSQQMAALEAELGLPLLKRSKSGTSTSYFRIVFSLSASFGAIAPVFLIVPPPPLLVNRITIPLARRENA